MQTDPNPVDSYTPVVLVHGTYAGPQEGSVQWFQPNSDFCHALDYALMKRELDVRCWAGVGGTSSYCHWGPGENDWLARAEASERLRTHLKQLKYCHIVAHSHGGNVVLDALGWTKGGTPVDWFSGTVTLLGTPIIERKERRAFYSRFLVGALAVAAVIKIALRPDLYLWPVCLVVGLPVSIFLARKLDPRKLLDFGNPLRDWPRLLIINSEQDEAYRFLSAVLKAPNPFLRNDRPRLLHALRSPLRRLWAESARPRSLSLSVRPAVLSVLGLFLFTVLAFDVGVVSDKWTYIALSVLSMVLIAFNYKFDTTEHEVFVWDLIDRLCTFSVRIGAFPARVLSTAAAKRMSWPFLKARALGLAGSPWKITDVNVALTPQHIRGTNGIFEYRVLPAELLERVYKDRAKDAKEQLDVLLEKMAATDWSLDSIQRWFIELQQPGLVHSCYYRYLEHGGIINAIANKIAEYEAESSGDINRVNAVLDYADDPGLSDRSLPHGPEPLQMFGNEGTENSD